MYIYLHIYICIQSLWDLQFFELLLQIEVYTPHKTQTVLFTGALNKCQDEGERRTP